MGWIKVFLEILKQPFKPDRLEAPGVDPNTKPFDPDKGRDKDVDHSTPDVKGDIDAGDAGNIA